MDDSNAAFLTRLPWRTGQCGRTVHAQFGGVASDRDPLIGTMDSPELAAEVCVAHNAGLAVHPVAAAVNAGIRVGLAECGEDSRLTA